MATAQKSRGSSKEATAGAIALPPYYFGPPARSHDAWHLSVDLTVQIIRLDLHVGAPFALVSCLHYFSILISLITLAAISYSSMPSAS